MKIGLLDYYLDEWHAKKYPGWIGQASEGKMEVTYAYAMMDSPHGGRTTDQWCKDMGITRLHSIEELVEKSDGLIVLAPDNGELHEALCQIPLRSGKRTFIDKAVALDIQTAKRIFDLAEAFKTPCYSASALRYEAAYQNIDSVDTIFSSGHGRMETYGVHQLEPIMMLMPCDPVRVLCMMDREGNSHYVYQVRDGRFFTMNMLLDDCPFEMTVCAGGKSRRLQADSNFWQPFIQQLVHFFATGESPVAQVDSLRIASAIGYGLKAREDPGCWVPIQH